MSVFRVLLLSCVVWLLACGGVAAPVAEPASPPLPDLLEPVAPRSWCSPDVLEHPSIGLLATHGGRLLRLEDSAWRELYRGDPLHHLAAFDGDEVLLVGGRSGVRLDSSGNEVSAVSPPGDAFGYRSAGGRLWHLPYLSSGVKISFFADGEWREIASPPAARLETSSYGPDGRFALLGERQASGAGDAANVDVMAVWDGSAWLDFPAPEGVGGFNVPNILGWDGDELWIRTLAEGRRSHMLWRVSVLDGTAQKTELPVDTWDALLAQGPDGRWHFAGGRVELKGEAASTHLVYDADSMRWNEASPLTTPRLCGTLASTEHGLLWLGGYKDGAPVLSIERL